MELPGAERSITWGGVPYIQPHEATFLLGCPLLFGNVQQIVAHKMIEQAMVIASEIRLVSDRSDEGEHPGSVSEVIDILRADEEDQSTVEARFIALNPRWRQFVVDKVKDGVRPLRRPS